MNSDTRAPSVTPLYHVQCRNNGLDGVQRRFDGAQNRFVFLALGLFEASQLLQFELFAILDALLLFGRQHGRPLEALGVQIAPAHLNVQVARNVDVGFVRLKRQPLFVHRVLARNVSGAKHIGNVDRDNAPSKVALEQQQQQQASGRSAHSKAA